MTFLIFWQKSGQKSKKQYTKTYPHRHIIAPRFRPEKENYNNIANNHFDIQKVFQMKHLSRVYIKKKYNY